MQVNKEENCFHYEPTKWPAPSTFLVQNHRFIVHCCTVIAVVGGAKESHIQA